jgi:hypothetical protein
MKTFDEAIVTEKAATSQTFDEAVVTEKAAQSTGKAHPVIATGMRGTRRFASKSKGGSHSGTFITIGVLRDVKARKRRGTEPDRVVTRTGRRL